MMRRRTRYQQAEEPQRFSQLEPGEPLPDAIFHPTHKALADYSYLINPTHRQLGWRLRGYYIPAGMGVGAKVVLDIPNPDPQYADSLWCGTVLGDGDVHWSGIRKQNYRLTGSPRETAFELTYEPRINPWIHERGLAHAAHNYLAAALADLMARFRPASHAHIPMVVEDPNEGRFKLLDIDDPPAPADEVKQLDLPFDQIRRLEID